MLFENLQGMVITGLIIAVLLWCIYCYFRKDRQDDEEFELERQRRMLGIKPGVGTKDQQRVNQARRTFPKRCPRGVCTNPGASCPRECVRAPIVKRLVDGRLVHEYDNVEICFDGKGEILEVKVDGRAWL